MKSAVVTSAAWLLFWSAAVEGNGQNCSAFRVKSDTANTDDVLVKATGVTLTDAEADTLAPGDQTLMRGGYNGISAVYVKAASGTLTVRGGPVVRSPRDAVKL